MDRDTVLVQLVTSSSSLETGLNYLHIFFASLFFTVSNIRIPSRRLELGVI
ncbi:hypothetical protein C5167_048135, partial [Papaver somniferum]